MAESASDEEQARALAETIARHWSDSRAHAPGKDALPAFLGNPLLADQIAQNSNVVAQVLDLRRFKSVYVSPNVEEVCGYSVAEINAQGVLQWLRNLSFRELVFQARNARLLGKVQKGLPPRTHFRSAMINSGMRTKAGGRLRIVSQNFSLDWDEAGKQHHQLFLWRDATHLVRGDDVVVRHQWTPVGRAPQIHSYDPERGAFVERDLFSPRELEILSHLRRGRSSKEIAADLQLSSLTVDNHRKNLIAAMRVRTTEGLVELCDWLRLGR